MRDRSAKKTILIVEDQDDILLTLKDFLEAENFDVVTAMNGKEALDFLAKNKMPSLILLDMKMPVMDGWEFSREFLRRYDHKCPMLIMTAADDAKKRAQEVNATDWLGKPFDLEEILERVRKFT